MVATKSWYKKTSVRTQQFFFCLYIEFSNIRWAFEWQTAGAIVIQVQISSYFKKIHIPFKLSCTWTSVVQLHFAPFNFVYHISAIYRKFNVFFSSINVFECSTSFIFWNLLQFTFLLQCFFQYSCRHLIYAFSVDVLEQNTYKDFHDT